MRRIVRLVCAADSTAYTFSVYDTFYQYAIASPGGSFCLASPRDAANCVEEVVGYEKGRYWRLGTADINAVRCIAVRLLEAVLPPIIPRRGYGPSSRPPLIALMARSPAPCLSHPSPCVVPVILPAIVLLISAVLPPDTALHLFVVIPELSA